jgi:hypothetical protein
VKTDRRDAVRLVRLARLLRIGEVPVIWVPTESEEAAGIWCGLGRMRGVI